MLDGTANFFQLRPIARPFESPRRPEKVGRSQNHPLPLGIVQFRPPMPPAQLTVADHQATSRAPIQRGIARVLAHELLLTRPRAWRCSPHLSPLHQHNARTKLQARHPVHPLRDPSRQRVLAGQSLGRHGALLESHYPQTSTQFPELTSRLIHLAESLHQQCPATAWKTQRFFRDLPSQSRDVGNAASSHRVAQCQSL